MEKRIAEVRETLETNQTVRVDSEDYKTSEMISEAVNLMALRELMLSHEEHRKNKDIYQGIQARFLKILSEYL